MAIADWQQYTQSILSGLIFSFLLAKLFSLILAFRDENTPANPNEHKPEVDKSLEEDKRSDAEITNKLLIDQQKKVVTASSEYDSDDDWEGVESTELYEAFSAAFAFVTATAADQSSAKVSNELKLQLYGLYKIATEGACSVPQPSAIKMTARAKWNAWHKLGAMPPEEAMQMYLEIITKLYPTWADDSTSKKTSGDSNKPSSRDSRPVRPVCSSFIHEEESVNELKLDAIHDFVREGDAANLLKCVEGGATVDTKDSKGRTPLHWAVDLGNIDVTELLLSRNVDVNIKVNEGQTPFHHAAVCDREAIAELLVKKNTGKDIKDDDGNYPSDLCDSNCPS